MRYPAAETAEKHRLILQHASRLFRERGFDGVSVAELMKSTGLTHGPFYNHFTSKEALMQESVRFTSSQALAELTIAERTPEELRAYVAQYLSAQHRDNPGDGCMLPSLGVEVGRAPLIKPALTEHFKQMIEKFTAHFPWAGKRNRRRDSIRLLSAMVGAQVLARSVDDADLSDEILAAVLSEFS